MCSVCFSLRTRIPFSTQLPYTMHTKHTCVVITLHCRFSFTKDYSSMTTLEALQTLGNVFGVPEFYANYDESYVITIDTLMKMLAIQLRVRYGIPVVIMGDTGCGKTHLIKYVVAVVLQLLQKNYYDYIDVVIIVMVNDSDAMMWW